MKRIINPILWGIIFLLFIGISTSFIEAEDQSYLTELQAPSDVNLIFPCDAKEITNIWIDDEKWWDGSKLGSILLTGDTCPETLELHSLVWYESIVVEWIMANPEKGVKVFRIRLKSDGTIVPQYTIPISNRRNL